MSRIADPGGSDRVQALATRGMQQELDRPVAACRAAATAHHYRRLSDPLTELLARVSLSLSLSQDNLSNFEGIRRSIAFC